eukprot:304086-Pyramimonas_sp.AAC.1
MAPSCSERKGYVAQRDAPGRIAEPILRCGAREAYGAGARALELVSCPGSSDLAKASANAGRHHLAPATRRRAPRSARRNLRTEYCKRPVRFPAWVVRDVI